MAFQLPVSSSAEQTQSPSKEIAASIEESLERLLAFEPVAFPVISLYLNTQADQHGRDNFAPFLTKELAARGKTIPPGSAERESFDQDAQKILGFLENDLTPEANGVAIFACAAADLFEAIQLSAPIDEHKLYVYHQPHLYHLARLEDEYPRYAAVLTNSNSARIFVFGLGETIWAEQVNGTKVNRVKVGGWSQARYQRRVENAQRDHAKELVAALDRVVQEDQVKHVILAGEPQTTAVLRDQLPKSIAGLVVDVLKIDLNASDREVFEATLDRLRQEDARTDAEKVERLFSEYRARGLACVGMQDTLEALANGQAHELLISASLEQTRGGEEAVDATLAPETPDSEGGTGSDEPRSVHVSDLLVTKAGQTDAAVTFIQDPALLESVEGVGAFLRWR
ncbi:MAG: host attachment protein [Bryobacteraceae bacterium]|nr:host attachment protein [Bryobacteraceae bacterium]